MKKISYFIERSDIKQLESWNMKPLRMSFVAEL